ARRQRKQVDEGEEDEERGKAAVAKRIAQLLHRDPVVDRARQFLEDARQAARRRARFACPRDRLQRTTLRFHTASVFLRHLLTESYRTATKSLRAAEFKNVELGFASRRREGDVPLRLAVSKGIARLVALGPRAIGRRFVSGHEVRPQIDQSLVSIGEEPALCALRAGNLLQHPARPVVGDAAPEPVVDDEGRNAARLDGPALPLAG